ncbi:MAG: bifunctional aspartate kinase/homoserine dehydrogenase I [Crocinitomicaceae bacterium]|nr:bifunctional aspartate kinase/homoserine dehydrogenase I [Crocinitomicaceae bacterium]
MVVIKFGGTSVSSKENLGRIVSVLEKKKENYIVVISAFSGVTNNLECLASSALENDVEVLLEELRSRHFSIVQKLFDISSQTDVLLKVQQYINELEVLCRGVWSLQELSDKTMAKMQSFGEKLSTLIVHEYLLKSGIEIVLLDSERLIVTDGDYLNGEVNFQETNQNISNMIGASNYLVGGFISANREKETVTLGRGGSDYSAAIFASAVSADSLEIWTDVNGFRSANPRLIENTKPIDSMSYEEAFELAYFGAKIVYPPSILPVMKRRIPVYLKNTMNPAHKGSFIGENSISNKRKVRGVSSLNSIAILTVSGIGLTKQKGKARKVFQVLEENSVNVIMITQSCSEQSIGIGVLQKDAKKAVAALDLMFKHEIERGIINPVKLIRNQCIIALVGDNMRNTIGLCGKVFSVIGENGINITAIAQGASERNISIVIDEKNENRALNAIHEKFFSDTIKNVHLFIAGVGNVGREFLKILEVQKENLLEKHNIRLRIVGMANSKKYLIDEFNGVSVTDLNKIGEPFQEFSSFVNSARELNLQNSVFIDNTASDIVSQRYMDLLGASMSVVTCNKIACSGDYDNYIELKQLARKNNCYFKYETSVGAALPILKTIEDLIISGDRISKIETVISGSLNFIFNEYKEGVLFSDVVKRARDEGYTEPNPLIDLSGLDVMRKILILAREAGYKRELSDVEYDSFLPKDCVSIDCPQKLFDQLKMHESGFRSRYNRALKNGNKLKVLASMNQGEMKVSLQEIASENPFYHLNGKDNAVAINTNRYRDEPLVIKGAGAGAGVTASGVFADLMSIVNK